MSRRLLERVLPALVIMLGLAAPATAQDRLEAGVWTGTVFTPDGEVIDLSYDVSYADDVLAIEIILPTDLGMGNVMAGNPMHEADTLVFTLDVGVQISCTLMAQDDGQFEGECVDSSGEGVLMTMIPPEDG
ncbi:MAG: hypothetical protein ACC682_08555 [Gemmatimonadota bacterium]